METITPENPSPTPPRGGKRTIFLTVICILTFIGSGWGIISSLRKYAEADKSIVKVDTEAARRKVHEQIMKADTSDYVEKLITTVTANNMAENIKITSGVKLISNLLTLLGAILMWNLRKIGFYMYIAGIVVLIMWPIRMGLDITLLRGVFVGFFGIIFIVLYAVNLKCMNKSAN